VSGATGGIFLCEIKYKRLPENLFPAFFGLQRKEKTTQRTGKPGIVVHSKIRKDSKGPRALSVSPQRHTVRKLKRSAAHPVLGNADL
jgi:hypothetical protein